MSFEKQGEKGKGREGKKWAVLGSGAGSEDGFEVGVWVGEEGKRGV